MATVQVEVPEDDVQLEDMADVVKVNRSTHKLTSCASQSESEDEHEEDGEAESEDKDEMREWSYIPTIISGSVSRIGDRQHNEDALIAVDDLMVDPRLSTLFSGSGYRQAAFYAVIDGHGGDKASTFVQKHLLPYVLEEPGFRRHDPEVAIRGAFLRLDDELRRLCVPGEGRCSGAVAVAAMILDGTLVVGNVGDCRAITSVRGKVVQLTTEHRPATDKDERERVLRSGTPISKRGYVGHAVAMTRALGDWDRPGLKRMEHGENVGPVLAEPQFRSLHVTLDHEFLILGSDGVWDALHSQHVVNIARRWLLQDGNLKKCAARIAAKAIRSSRQTSRADNVTCVVVCFPSQSETARECSNPNPHNLATEAA